MLRILGRASSINVRKVLWTCAEIGVPFVREDWGSGYQSTNTPEFLALNPNALVPVMIDGDFVLWESNTICRYLAGKHARTDLLPADPRARAQVEQWMDWQATELNTSARYPFLSLVRNSPDHQDRRLLETAIASWNQCMGILDRQLESTGAYLVGKELTLADVVIGLSVHRWLMTPMARPECASVAAYYERLRLRPAFLEQGALSP